MANSIVGSSSGSPHSIQGPITSIVPPSDLGTDPEVKISRDLFEPPQDLQQTEAEILPESQTETHQNRSPKSTPFTYNSHNEAIFDNPQIFPSVKAQDLAKFDSENPDLINHATILALVVQLTSPEVVDYNLIYDFFITYRMFSDGHTIMNLLMTRLIWSLQNINGRDEKVGKLVLLRTFVVLRHWILNYFIDDFVDGKLGDIFTNNLNDIVFNSGLIHSDMIFEKKIITDLKNHWLNVICEFWSFSLDVSTLNNEDIYNYYLPSSNDLNQQNFMKKSSTEMSIHTNPSYRRSAMLSLYDLKTHHKCLVFDETKFKNENPQISVNNLLILHKSSRQSIMNKLNHIHVVKKRETTSAGSEGKSPLKSTTKHNRMNLDDSSNGLKTIKKTGEETNMFLNPMVIDNVGFSTNGHVRLPSSKVMTIVPLTPVKKMEYTIRNPNQDEVLDWDSPLNSRIIDNIDVQRKHSIKRILEGWKKNKHSNKSTEEINQLINDSISEDIIGDRVDVLSARIVDELEYLIRNYIRNDASLNPTIIEGDSIDNTNNFNRPQSNDEVDLENFDDSIDLLDSSSKNEVVADESVVDIQDRSGLTLNEIDHLFSDPGVDDDEEDEEDFKDTKEDFETNQAVSPNFINDIHEFSFQRPTSISWKDDGLESEVSDSLNEASLPVSASAPVQLASPSSSGPQTNSQAAFFNKVESDDELPEPNLPRDISHESIDVLGGPQLPFVNNNNNSRSSSISTPSNMTDYNAEIEDLGIAVSPKSKEQQARRISFGANRGSTIGNRISRNSSNSIFKRESVKSYVSYDSDFSVSRGSLIGNDDNHNLRKKAGVNDLRRLAGLPTERKSLDNAVRVQSSSSVRKSIRTSTILALSELPFNGAYDSKSSVNLTGRKVTRNSGVGDSSIFSVAVKSRSSIANSFQTLNEGTINSSEFAFNFRASGNSDDDPDVSNRSVAIPGISNNVLKELAAIPDDSFHFNPIDFALNKLEGSKDKKTSDQNSETTQVELDDTQDILNEINNADTRDIIDTSSQKDIGDEEMPLTPVGKQESKLISTGGTVDSTALEEGANTDNVFIFSANYSNESKTSRSNLAESYQSPRLILQTFNVYDNSLSIDRIVSLGSHISFILSYSSQELTEHFTLIERDILQEIDWKELIELKWNKDLTPVNSWLEIIVNEEYYNSNKGVNLVIARFNLMVNWIISEVLLTKQLDERVQIISRFIHIGQSCLQLQNYSTLMQILLALTSERLAKLRNTWKSLPPGDILILKNLEELASPVKNFLNLRVSINKIQPSKGCIPFVGLYLSDLIFNTERPKFVNKSLVNFARFRTSVHIVKSLSQCIEWLTYYKFDIDNELLSKGLYIRSLDEDEMNYCIESLKDE